MQSALSILGWFLIAAAAASCLYAAAATPFAVRFAARRPAPRAAPVPVTVLKPLCGEDRGLYDNLASLCRQNYGTYQIVFGVRETNDPAIAVVERLRRDFPAADIALAVDGRVSERNLKVSNLVNMLPLAKHGVLVIADSDMRVRPDYLAEIAAPLADPAIGAVTCLYRGVSAGGLWSDLACQFVNHGFLPQAVLAERLGVDAGCFGATMVIRRATLDALGGFAAIGAELADDYALGRAVRGLGLKVALSRHIVDNVIHHASFEAMMRHELRWARTTRVVEPAGYLGSVLTHTAVLAALALPLGVATGVGLPLFAVALAGRLVMVRLLDRALALPPTPLWRVPVRDLLQFGLFVASYLGRHVSWRRAEFRVDANGRMVLTRERPI